MIKINTHEYEYLKGNTQYWPRHGAAMAVVRAFCNDNRLGDFGVPTEKGLACMQAFEKENEL